MQTAGSGWLLILLPVALVFAGCKPPPRSDPAAQRDDKRYRAALNPAPPAWRTNSAFSSTTISNDATQISITRPSTRASRDESDGQAHQLRLLRPGEVVEGSNAAFRVLAYGFWIPTAPITNGQNYAPLGVYAPDGRPLNPPDQREIGLDPQRARVWAGNETFPDLTVWIGDMQRPPGYIRPVAVFDGRTKAQITSGSSWGQVYTNHPGNIRHELTAWHSTPLEMIVDVELAGKVVREVAAVPGSRHELPGGEVFFAGFWDGDANSTSSYDDGKTDHARIGLRTDDSEPRTSAIFLTDPPELSVHLALLGANGKVLDGHGGMTSGNIRVMSTRTNAEAIARIRFTVFTNHHRVVISLPPLAGLPPENRDVRDLFDVRIPRAEIRSEYDLRRLISGATQMEFRYSTTNAFPPGFFPRTFTNVTPAGLLDLHGRFLSPDRVFVVDREKQEIRVEPPRWRKVWLWIRTRLRLN